MKNVLITGGAGFIGSNLTERLIDDGGYAVTVIDDESIGNRRVVEALGAKFVKGDLLNLDLVSDLCRGKDAVIHLAADSRVMDSIEDPVHNFRVNVEGTFRLLNIARAAGVGRVINASTGGAIVGEATPPISEEFVARPLSPYGASKLAAEGYCSAFTASYGLPTASLRFSNIYGPHSLHKGSVVAVFFRRILRGEDLVIFGDGSQVRDYLFVGDLVAGIQLALERRVSGVFQLGSGNPTTLNQLLGVIREVAGADYPFKVVHEDFRHGEIRETWCDIARAREHLGFSPATALYDGLKTTWNWFRAKHEAS